MCEEAVVNFAWFPETSTGREVASIERAKGHCIDNAIPIPGAPPESICKADGSWDILGGGCQCNAGYMPVEQRCEGMI